MKTQIGLLVLLIAVCSQLAVSQQSKTADVEVEGVLVTLIDDVEVSVEEPGLLSEVKVVAGQIVKAGDLLARTNDQEQQIRKNKAEIELRNSERLAKNKIKIRLAKKAQEVAQTEWKRGKESLKRYKKSVSLTEIDRLRLAAERAALDVEQANYDHGTAQLAVDLNRTEVKLADHMAKRRTVVSPISGVVVMVKRKKGEWVKPGEMFVRVVSTKRLQAETFVSAKHLDKVKTGQRVSLIVSKTQKFSGKVVFVSPEISPVNGQCKVWAEIANPEGKLRAGQRAAIVIHMK